MRVCVCACAQDSKRTWVEEAEGRGCGTRAPADPPSSGPDELKTTSHDSQPDAPLEVAEPAKEEEEEEEEEEEVEEAQVSSRRER